MQNIENKDLIVEDLNNLLGGDPNIAQTDQNLSIDNIFQQTNIQSLARQVCSTIQLLGPSGALYNIIKKTDGFKLIRKDLVEFPSEILKTELLEKLFKI